MSNSKKKSPYVSITTATSEKEDKALANRKERKVNKTILAKTGDDERMVDRKSVSDTWNFSKDGKRRIDPNEESKHLRK